MACPQGKTVDGFETQIGINHLGHFLLTELLLDAIKKGAPSRIVNVSSCFHDKAMGKEGKMDFDDLFFEKRDYDKWESYAQSKLANVLYAKGLAKRLEGTGVTAVSLHPGWVRTNLGRHVMFQSVQDFFLRPFLKVAGMIEPWEGAQTSLYTLLSPDVVNHSGEYYSQVGIYRDKACAPGGWPLRSPNPHAHDDEAVEKLHEKSADLVGLA
jgi:NAD(P)-dependent dehydrogenase (short-subunit alcohol dehydrogenase family)